MSIRSARFTEPRDNDIVPGYPGRDVVVSDAGMSTDTRWPFPAEALIWVSGSAAGQRPRQRLTAHLRSWFGAWPRSGDLELIA